MVLYCFLKWIVEYYVELCEKSFVSNSCTTFFSMNEFKTISRTLFASEFLISTLLPNFHHVEVVFWKILFFFQIRNQRVWKPLRPNFSANSRYFYSPVHHFVSAILNVWDLNSDSYSASLKTQGNKFLRQISFFIIFLCHFKSAILNLRDLTSIVVQELLTNDFSQSST